MIAPCHSPCRSSWSMYANTTSGGRSISMLPVIGAMTGILSDRGCDRVERLGILDRREVARVDAERGRAHRPPHDLRRARLRQRLDEDDPGRPERASELGC